MVKVVRLLAKTTPMLILAACFDSGPSEKDARAAFVEADSGRDYFEGFKLVACKAASGSPGYQCDFTYQLQGGPHQPASGRFFKANDKWVFEQSRR